MILLIDKSQKDATLVSEILFNMGFLSLAVTPERAPSEISNRFRAVIFLSPERMGSLEEYVPMIRKFSLGSPIFALCRKPYFEEEALFDKVFYNAEISYDLIGAIIEVQTTMKKRRIGSYRAMGIDASVYSDEVTFFDIPLGLTKTETMILRYIAVNFPTRVKANDILRFAFKSGRCPEIANIRTHISSINKKFVKVAKRQFIVSENRIGYTLATPPDIFAAKNAENNKITK
ncbi:MAG: helix-turn-helix domain-containing protein [Clostridia bacterium]|nr:helix-turn-helix domain-containing protein [Clostridia bacterium]